MSNYVILLMLIGSVSTIGCYCFTIKYYNYNKKFTFTHIIQAALYLTAILKFCFENKEPTAHVTVVAIADLFERQKYNQESIAC